MASKSKVSRQAQSKVDKNFDKKLLAIPLIALVIKLITITNIPGQVWLGADGENYITGLNALVKDGVFSTERLLSYWPAGYPLLMFLFSVVSLQQTLLLTVLFQTALYALASWYFVKQISKTTLKKFAFPIALIIAFNPTLSLSTLTIGYESISAAIFILAVALFISEYSRSDRKLITWRSIAAAGLLSLSSFVQPRFVLASFLFLAIWAFVLKPKKIAVVFLVLTTVVLAVLPSSLVLRNVKANDFATISTNLGITMNLGAGPGATGAYIKEGYGVPCDAIEGNEAQQDVHLRNCVISWYLKNPGKSLELFYNKARFFWSPWSGPEASGSMARNPWLKISPFVSIGSNSQSGSDLVNGAFGRLTSWFWMLGSLVLLGFGIFKLWKAQGLARYIGLSAGVIVLANWVVSVGTLGDHRQRLPIMTLSLFLQVIGFTSLVQKRKYRIPVELPALTQTGNK
jgi:hypothetical protein